MDKNVVYGVHLHNLFIGYLDIMHASMHVDKSITCRIIQKVLFKTTNDQNWPHQLFCIKYLPTVMFLVLAFCSQKMSFLINKTLV